MSFYKIIGLLLVGLMFSANVQARLLLVASQESGLYQEFVAGFQGHYAAFDEEVDVVFDGDFDFGALDKYRIIVIAGVEAAKKLVGRDSTDALLIYTMMPLSSYQWLMDNGYLSKGDGHKVLYIDQPVGRYVSLAKEAFPRIKSLGFLYGDVSAVYVDELKQELDAEKMELVEGQVLPEMRLPGDLKGIFLRSDALLLMPDPYLYNRRSVQGVLLASFRYQRPLISYSESFVKAGALLGLYSTPRDIGKDTADLVSCFKENCGRGKAHSFYPTYFSVVVNTAVARQLGVKVKSSEELQKHLETIENITH